MEIIRIALAGGPGSGKSRCLEALQKALRPGPEGTAVVFLPEVATYCFSHRTQTVTDREDAVIRQHYIYCTQKLNEDAAAAAAQALHAGRLILISDRGVMDMGTYLHKPEEWYDAGLLKALPTDHYDYVLYLLGGADIRNDTTYRVEADDTVRRAVAEASYRAWSQAKHVEELPMYPTLEAKAGEVKRRLNRFLGETLFTEEP